MNLATISLAKLYSNIYNAARAKHSPVDDKGTIIYHALIIKPTAILDASNDDNNYRNITNKFILQLILRNILKHENKTSPRIARTVANPAR